MSKRIREICIVLVIAFSALASNAEKWERFISPGHFTVKYPSGWSRISASADRLQLRSAQSGSEGVIIKRGQALVMVIDEHDPSAQTLAQAIKEYNDNASIISTRGEIVKTNAPNCANFKEVVSREPLVPAQDASRPVPYMVNTELFCETEGHRFIVILRNFEGDSRQQKYQQIIETMIKSIRALS